MFNVCFCAQKPAPSSAPPNLNRSDDSTEVKSDSPRSVDAITGASNLLDEKRLLDYEAELQKNLASIGDVTQMTLATSLNDQVTSRTISTACLGDTIYFITWRHHTKCAQIRKNPNVSLNHNQTQITGTAEIKGNPLTEQNKIYTERYKEKLLDVYNEFSSFDELVIVEIKINAINFFKEEEGNYFLETIDLRKKQAYDCSLYENPKKN
jgi:general stress protein 26